MHIARECSHMNTALHMQASSSVSRKNDLPEQAEKRWRGERGGEGPPGLGFPFWRGGRRNRRKNWKIVQEFNITSSRKGTARVEIKKRKDWKFQPSSTFVYLSTWSLLLSLQVDLRTFHIWKLNYITKSAQIGNFLRC